MKLGTLLSGTVSSERGVRLEFTKSFEKNDELMASKFLQIACLFKKDAINEISICLERKELNDKDYMRKKSI